MSALNGVVRKTHHFLVFGEKDNRKLLPFFFFAVSFIGSLLKALDVVPSSYFSNSRNLLTVYFVNFSWRWNLFLLLPFIFMSNSYNKNIFFVAKRLMSLVVATAIWYFCTEMFLYIEGLTGKCYESHDMQAIREEFGTKAECKNSGHFWYGFDISGHSFILSYSTLLIVEEMVPMLHLIQQSPNRTIVLDALYLALNAITILWMWMFACTSVYFHDMIQKILGTLFGVLSWYVTYKVWYMNPFSPGLPPCHTARKQHD